MSKSVKTIRKTCHPHLKFLKGSQMMKKHLKFSRSKKFFHLKLWNNRSTNLNRLTLGETTVCLWVVKDLRSFKNNRRWTLFQTPYSY